jgi:hypothetical protein
MVITKTHGFTRLKGIKCAKDGSVAKALGNPTGIKWVDRFGGDVTGGA